MTPGTEPTVPSRYRMPPVGGEDLAGDKGGLLPAEVGHRRGHILRPPQPAHGGLLRQLGQGLRLLSLFYENEVRFPQEMDQNQWIEPWGKPLVCLPESHKPAG